MTTLGWVLMIGSVGGVLALTAYCFFRVLRTPVTKDHLHAPLDIDTHEKLE
jgi:hypothetical protein